MTSQEGMWILIALLIANIIFLSASWIYLRIKDKEGFNQILKNLNREPQSKYYDETREATDKELSRLE